MPEIQQDFIYAVSRIRSTFADDIGNGVTGLGTGVWVDAPASAGRARFFVTNKHNVDYALRSGGPTKLRLARIELELRSWTGGVWGTETQFVDINDFEANLVTSDKCDCAVLDASGLKSRPPNFRILSVPVETLATAKNFAEDIRMMEDAVFLGFPGRDGQHWWDESQRLPIARQCLLASLPSEPFQNGQIATDDVLHVSGMSFTGSSGSPVILPQVGVPPGGSIVTSRHHPLLLVGLMSGSFWEKDTAVPKMFQHTGLSYMTRSTAILDVLERMRRR